MARAYTIATRPVSADSQNRFPADAPPPVYETRVGGASDPEWQCRVPQEFYGGFQALPEHCQTSVLRQLTKGLDEIYGFTPRKRESHPGRIVTVGPDRPHGPAGHGKADALRARALVSTAREPSDDTGDDDEIGIGTFAVDIKKPGPDPIEFNNAEFTGDNSWTADPPPPPGDCDDNTLQLFFLKDTRDYTDPADEENNNYIHKSAVGAMLNILAGASELGIDLVFSDVFRDTEMQEKRWNEFLNGGPKAARPGTSAHEAGMAVDVYILVDGRREVPGSNRKFLAMLRNNGFRRTNSEAWHFEWKGFSTRIIAGVQEWAKKCVSLV